MAAIAFAPSAIAAHSAPGHLTNSRLSSTAILSTSFSQRTSCCRLSLSTLKARSGCRVALVRATAETEEVTPVAIDGPAEVAKTEAPAPKKKKKQVTAPTKRQLLTLKFLWLDKNIGIALDQVVPGQGVVPVSSYMFWPRKDAWEQLKNLLDEKPWVSKKRAIILLNQATDIINQWQQTSYKP